jgi:serine/threonine-protein kinase
MMPGVGEIEMAKRTIGPFEIESKLGTGGMGVVYLATYRKTGQKVALKVLTPALSVDEQLLKRFEREMEILKRLRHNHIVRYYGGGKHGTQHFYAMELIDGGSLEDRIKKQGRLSWEQTIDYSIQIAKALEHSHFHAIIHRDLKPANCFMTSDGTLKLGDFGIARDTQATALTAAGKTVGTYAYMAPEQISGKPPISRRTDLYALGCVMFEMLTGKPPFEADTPAQMLFSHLKEEPPRVTSAALDCPAALETIIDKLLEKDPEERFFDALALQVALSEVSAKVAAQASIAKQTVSGGTTKATTKKDRTVLENILGIKRKKRKAGPIYEQASFLAGCLLLLIAGVVWLMWPPSEAELYAKASELMSEDDPSAWTDAERRYLTPMINRFPDGQYANQARQWLDDIPVRKARRQSQKRYEQGKPPESPAEGQFFEAKKFEDFGDRVSALQRFNGLVELYGNNDDPGDRAIVQLAQERIQSIEKGGEQAASTIAAVNAVLRRGDEFLAKGRKLEAQKAWNSVIALYGNNDEFEPQVKYARARLAGQEVEPLQFDDAPPSDGTKDNGDAGADDREEGR